MANGQWKYFGAFTHACDYVVYSLRLYLFVTIAITELLVRGAVERHTTYRCLVRLRCRWCIIGTTRRAFTRTRSPEFCCVAVTRLRNLRDTRVTALPLLVAVALFSCSRVVATLYIVPLLLLLHYGVDVLLLLVFTVMMMILLLLIILMPDVVDVPCCCIDVICHCYWYLVRWYSVVYCHCCYDYLLVCYCYLCLLTLVVGVDARLPRTLRCCYILQVLPLLRLPRWLLLLWYLIAQYISFCCCYCCWWLLVLLLLF